MRVRRVTAYLNNRGQVRREAIVYELSWASSPDVEIDRKGESKYSDVVERGERSLLADNVRHGARRLIGLTEAGRYHLMPSIVVEDLLVTRHEEA